MFVVRNLLLAIASVLDMALQLYLIVLIVRVLISWVSPDPYNPIVRFLHTVTEPVLRPTRELLYRRLGVPMTGIDFSPILVIFLVYFLQIALVRSLRDLAMALG